MAAHSSNSMSSQRKPKKKLKDMDVDEFLMDDFDTSESESSLKSIETSDRKQKMTKKKPKAKKQLSPKVSESSETDVLKKGEKKSALSTGITKKKKESSKTNVKALNSSSKNVNKLSLANTIKDSDPEFYQFLKNEDKSLLTNLEDLSDEESEDSDFQSENVNGTADKNDNFEKELLNMSSGSDEDDSDMEESPKKRKVHKLPEKLAVASDESDSDDESDDTAQQSQRRKDGIRVTNKMVDAWTNEIQSQPSQQVLRQMISAFHAAVQEAAGSVDESESTRFYVEGGSVFNSVVRMCLVNIAPALQTMLKIPKLSDAKQAFADKTGRWKNLKKDISLYLYDLLDLITQLSEAAMVNAMLKHIHKLVLFYANFPKLSKKLMKKMIKLWTTGEETTRVLAFLCINKLVHLKRDLLLEPCVKQMYMAYVSNCKFTSPTTLPLINFMQRSMVEIFNIDQTVAYQYAFVYIRQLAIHLRNAIAVKKKNTCQAVYNWQYIHCLGLWVQLLTSTFPSDVLQPLIYPLTQTIIGTVKLLPTARFYPLRFHCVKLLNILAAKTNTFIPTLPFLLEIFEHTDFNKRHKTVSLKPFNFAVILKFSKSQLQEKAFKDGLIDQLYEHILESYNVQAHSIGFPELIIPSVIQLKDFLKKCKVANYCKQIKQIVDKILEQSKFMAEKRKQSSLSLDNSVAIAQWENQLDNNPSPLRKFYTSWRKLRDRELMHSIANKEMISGAAIDIPEIERKPPKKATEKEREDFSKLFEDQSDSDDETRFLLKEERPKNKKRKHSDGSDDSDMYSDFDDEELEQLAQSASSNDEDSDYDEGGDVENDDSEDDSDADEADSSDGEEVVAKSQKGKKNVKASKAENEKKNKKQKVEMSVNVNGLGDNEEDDVVEDFVMSESDSE